MAYKQASERSRETISMNENDVSIHDVGLHVEDECQLLTKVSDMGPENE